MRAATLLHHFAAFNAPLHKAGTGDRRARISMAGHDFIKHFYKHADKVFLLDHISGLQFFHRDKVPGIAGMRSYLLSGNRIFSVIQCQLENFQRVEKTGIRLIIGFSCHDCLGAADKRIVSCFL